MSFKHILSLALMLIAFRATSQDLDSVASSASADLKTALSELSTVRQEVERERTELARTVNALEQKLSEQRAAFAKAQRFQENQLVELNALKAEAKKQADEVKYIDSLLNEYSRSFRSRLNFIEEPRYQPTLERVDRAEASTDLAPAARAAQRSELLTVAIKRAEAALGGELFEGKALDQKGLVQSGKVALVGPVAVFAGTAENSSGLLQQELNKSDPTVLPVDASIEEASRVLASTGKGQLPLDATLGNAVKLSALHDSFYEQLEKGGLMMIPLIGLGIAAVVLALFKWIQLSRVRLVSEAELQEVLQRLESGDAHAARAKAQSISGIAGDLLATAVEHAEEKKEYIEEVLYEKMLGARVQLERGIAFLALSATTGPLMGLLGTVMGMIATFKLISSFGSGDPKLLAAGISEALICTAAGMGVAIPALLFHAFLSRKAKGIIGSLEKTAVGFVNGVPEREQDLFT